MAAFLALRENRLEHPLQPVIYGVVF